MGWDAPCVKAQGAQGSWRGPEQTPEGESLSAVLKSAPGGGAAQPRRSQGSFCVQVGFLGLDMGYSLWLR